MEPLEHRSRYGRGLCVALWLVCGFAVVREIGVDQASGWALVPWLALLSLLAWACYWNPRLAVDDAGVHVVNVLRTIDLPWPSIQRIDTKWALTFFTAYGHFAAWCAPAPGVRGTAALGRARRGAVAESAVAGGGVRPGDLPGSPSGDAAVLVRRRWESLRDAGHLDDPRLEFARAPVRWHWPIIAGVLVLAAGCVATLV